MLDNLETEYRIKARRFKRYGVGPRDGYPGRSLSGREIQIESNALKSTLSQLNDIHAIAAPGAQDFSSFQPTTLQDRYRPLDCAPAGLRALMIR
jgi:hypothetical protein